MKKYLKKKNQLRYYKFMVLLKYEGVPNEYIITLKKKNGKNLD